MINVGVIGASGYAGVELLRILDGHSQVNLIVATSAKENGRVVADLFPGLRNKELVFRPHDSEQVFDCELVFFATPNATAMHQVPKLLEAGVKVVDLSADFRLKDLTEWAFWYGQEHACPELLNEAIYGLPEVNRAEIRNARLVANPGCYPTAIQLGFLPLLENDIINPSLLIADAKSGVSGAGRKASLATQYCKVNDSFKAYSVGGRRHLPEIKQGLNKICSSRFELVFVPHLAPMSRGIHATLYATLAIPEVDLQAVFEKRYKNEPFVNILAAGSHPETHNVRGGNCCQLAVHRPQDGDTVVVLAVEDNLVKGAAGQAIQNMNIMFGFEEITGLTASAVYP